MTKSIRSYTSDVTFWLRIGDLSLLVWFEYRRGQRDREYESQPRDKQRGREC